LGCNVTPSEFAPGENVTLYAQAVNPLDGQPLENVSVAFLLNGSYKVNETDTDSNGLATVIWQYPADGTVCTMLANVTRGANNNTIRNCTLAVQPLTLTVGKETQLLLQAWRDPQGTGHTIYAQLVNGSGYPLSGENVTLTVNGTAYVLPPTNGTGYVALHLALQPGDTGANTYEVVATFNGTNPRSLSINASDPYSDQYVVCTTNQYDLRPSTNSSMLSALLQTTDAITAAKTMERNPSTSGKEWDAKASGVFRCGTIEFFLNMLVRKPSRPCIADPSFQP
jgi:hypothetical protein